MSDDRELLEAAAAAAGLGAVKTDERARFYVLRGPLDERKLWNPLDDDGDALRLLAKMRMRLQVDDYGASARIAHGSWTGCTARDHGGIETATRRAIVCAAAANGKASAC